MIIELEGDPVAKMRHRSFVRQGTVHSYDPQDEIKKKIRFLLTIKLRKALDSKDKAEVMEATALSRGAVFRVSFEFYLAPPAAKTARETALLLWYGEANIKPDFDNLVKFYADAASGALWPDDKLVVSSQEFKAYTTRPRTVLKITGSQPMSLHEKAEGILSLFPPDKFDDFLQDVFEAIKAEAGCMRHPEGDVPVKRKERAARAAVLLSKVADKYADELKKVKKNYPGWWQEADEKKTQKAI